MSKKKSQGIDPKYRNPDGTFKKGCPGGPGNPVLRKQKEYRNMFENVLHGDAFKDLVKKLIEKALDEADYSSAKFLIEQCIGKPKQTVENINPEQTARQAQEFLKSMEINEAPIKGKETENE
jgi:hypothetical protein